MDVPGLHLGVSMAAYSPYLIVCATPRTGSTLLARLLEHHGGCVGGEEFFEHIEVMPTKILPRLGIASVDAVRADLPAYVEAIKRHHAASGKTLCLKLHWTQVSEWQPHGLDLQKMFPGARYLHVRRTNLAAQTASLVRAMQTGAWTADCQTRDQGPQYGFWKFMFEMSALARSGLAWEPYFTEHQIEPYRLVYEDLDSNFQHEAIKLLQWLGMRVGPLMRLRLRPSTAKQRDQLNRQWEERFYSDLLHWHTQWEQLPIEERRRVWAREAG
jgi:LPS sulfotransferase NodH